MKLRRTERKPAPDKPGVTLSLKVFFPAEQGQPNPFGKARMFLKRLQELGEVLELDFFQGGKHVE
jgi:hypothetical protein